MSNINDVIQAHGYESYMACAYTVHKPKNLYVTSLLPYQLKIRYDILISRLTGRMGYRYKKQTENFIKLIEKINPDLIHLHNIHGDWINLKLLFDFLKSINKPVVWTLHDCWSFTGRCSHFEQFGCFRWKTGCHDCKNNKVYPITYFFDRSEEMWEDKKIWFGGLKNLTVVTPSEWLAGYVRESFFRDKNIITIHNGIDTSVYSPQKNISEACKNILGKKIILGVANSWNSRKGLDDFVKIDSIIDHSKYQIVLVGLNNRQLKALPNTIIKLGRTNSEREIAELYSGASVFVNPTYQDNYPTTNLEAQSCGTLCVTYNTGGSPESIWNKKYVLEKGDIKALVSAIYNICEQGYDREAVRNYALNNFAKELCCSSYCNLYKKLAMKH